MGRPRRPKRSSKRAKFPESGNARKPRERPSKSSPLPKKAPTPTDSPPLEPSGAGSAESVMRILPLRTCLVSEGRSEMNGDRFWTRTYVLPSGREIQVKTVMEMERADGDGARGPKLK